MSDLISRKEIIDRLERVIQNGVPSEDGMHPISAETVLEVVKSQLSTNLAEVGTDCISRQAVLNEFCHSCDGWSCNPNTCCKTEWIRKLPVVQPERKECEEREQGKCPWYAG